ncbi:MAG: hypothetical protein KUG81_06180 [Gammaproteobacteria bacterium]|nr:hypothetical protein [Gammaproteobacteria bacterium]
MPLPIVLIAALLAAGCAATPTHRGTLRRGGSLPSSPDPTPLSSHAGSDRGQVSAGVNYASLYLWRGFDFYGEDRGVILPWVKYSTDRYEFKLVGEGAPDLLFGEATTTEKEWVGLNYNGAYKTSWMDGDLKATFGFWYLQYFNAEHEQRSRQLEECAELGIPAGDCDVTTYSQDSIKGYVNLGLPNAPFSPNLSYTHYYFISDRGQTRTRDGNYYIILSGQHPIARTEESSLALGSRATYFRYDSADVHHISELVAFTKFSTTFDNGWKMFAGLNYAFVPPDVVAGMSPGNHHKLFSTFGVSVSF